MPSVITPSVVVRDSEQSGYLWTTSSDGQSLTRNLTNLERMFVVFNKDLHGQNCPFWAASITIQHQDDGTTSEGFDSWQLHTRAREAFRQTRWKYPTVAAQVVGTDSAVYNIESEEKVKEWSDRTVTLVSQEGGWEVLREQLSRDTAMPSKDGDYCLFYIIVKPDECLKPQITTFDILIHIHHVFTDGAGIQCILNEFLARLANPLKSEEMEWGQEIDRLLPPAILLEKVEEDNSADDVKPLENAIRLKGFDKPDVGLPVYRPELGPPSPELRGTQLALHTFEDSTFLRRLLAVGRRHGVKLAALLHAALLQAIYNTAEIKPTDSDFYKSGSALNLRGGYLLPEFCEPHKYVNSAVAIHPIEVPSHLFRSEGTDEDFWRAAKFIGKEWELIKAKKNMSQAVERDTGVFLENWEKMKNLPASARKAPAKPRTCPYFVSDAPGSALLSPMHQVAGSDMVLVLESYQMATDQSQAVVSARSHSWNDKLTLCLVFNAKRNPKRKMQEFLAVWSGIVESVCGF